MNSVGLPLVGTAGPMVAPVKSAPVPATALQLNTMPVRSLGVPKAESNVPLSEPSLISMEPVSPQFEILVIPIDGTSIAY